MEAALRSCWKGIDIGKILVHRSHTVPVRTDATVRKTIPGKPLDDSPTASKPRSPIARDVNGNYYRRKTCDSRPHPFLCHGFDNNFSLLWVVQSSTWN
jgi:hypothetical protein